MFSLLFREPKEPPCEQGQDAHTNERNISDPRHRRSFALRLFGVVQSFLSLSLSCGHCIELLALLAQSRRRLLFARADEIDVQGRGLGRTLRPTRRPSLRFEDIVT